MGLATPVLWTMAVNNARASQDSELVLVDCQFTRESGTLCDLRIAGQVFAITEVYVDRVKRQILVRSCAERDMRSSVGQLGPLISSGYPHVEANNLWRQAQALA
jgi:hypothetical protein